MNDDRPCCAYDGVAFGLWVQSLTPAERYAAAEDGWLTYRLPVLAGADEVPRMGGEGYRIVAYGHLGAVRSRFSVLELCASCGRGEEGPDVAMWGRPTLDRLRERIEAAMGGEWALTLEDAHGGLGVYVWSALAIVPDGLAAL